ncbi:oligosaccharide flippase family protein [Jannaschia sp. 2305UL9-9]|uniref:oligosaccharide flippase family protein n=1 Tax=Jannaschia sp. 2305UL9-9 TaxID=3121638 RepID=UPI003529C723
MRARALRSGLAAIFLMGGSQGLRFASNLVLTRLLFPEAFGLMALVQVVVGGASLLSDVGLRTSVIQSDRGDDPGFLNTIWTLQVVRGVLLWMLVCAIAIPVGNFYEEPLLTVILPVCGLQLLVQGFVPTRFLTAQRHLRIGRITQLQLAGQALGIGSIIVLAWALQSVWALAIGMVLTPLITQVLYMLFLPGPGNRFGFEAAAAKEILHFGKYLMLSTVAAYVLTRSDRALLGTVISVEMLGIYSIGLALARLPQEIFKALSSKVLLPVYKKKHPADSPENRANVFKLRRAIVAAILGLTALLAVFGPALVSVLYDDRFLLSGAVVCLVAVAIMPVIVTAGTVNASLAKGDSFRYMLTRVSIAVVQVIVMVLLLEDFGIVGVAISFAAAPILTYPLLASVLRKYGNWDWKADLGFFVLSALVAIFVVKQHGELISRLP